jgi:hypothetical protein
MAKADTDTTPTELTLRLHLHKAGLRLRSSGCSYEILLGNQILLSGNARNQSYPGSDCVVDSCPLFLVGRVHASPSWFLGSFRLVMVAPRHRTSAWRKKFATSSIDNASPCAAERRLPESEIKKAVGRLSTRDVLRFARKHRVNMDWLICGDLKGLLETARGCPSRPQQPILTPDELLQEFRAVRPSTLILLAIEKATPDQVEFLLAYCRQIVKNGGDAA